MRREFTGQNSGTNIGATLAQMAQEGGAGIARGSDVYTALVGAPVGVHVMVDVLVGGPQTGAIVSFGF